MRQSQFKRKTSRFIRFIAAIAVGLIGACFVDQPAVTPSGVYFMLRAIAARKRAGFWTVYRRFRGCKRCPVLYRTLMSCGSPLRKDRDLGCYCALEVKCGLPNATCWLADQGARSRWPE